LVVRPDHLQGLQTSAVERDREFQMGGRVLHLDKIK
jgi:hypothetical protein